MIFEWIPLTYFTFASLLLPKDNLGCSLYAHQRILLIMEVVFGPVLILRCLGMMFANKSHLIFWQIIVIYTWFVVSLTWWVFSTAHGMKFLDSECYHPLKVSLLNLITMVTFYMFMLAPYIGVVIFLPQVLYQIWKAVNHQKRQMLAKHYLIKRMPSIVFNKKMFEGSIECSICMEPFKEGVDFVTPLACDARHFYHSDCIEEWLNNKNECPLCKI